MNEDFMTALRYIFVLSVILILVAYWVGSTNLLGTAGAQLGSLINTSTGRTSSGTFASYPSGA